MEKETVTINNTDGAIPRLTVRTLTLGDGIPKICIPVTAADEAELNAQLDRMLEGPCELVEWRADYYASLFEEGALERAAKTIRRRIGERPLLFTFRTREEGGERTIPLEEYVQLNLRAAKTEEVDLIDIELNRGEALAEKLIEEIQACGARTVASFHDFVKTPDSERLLDIFRTMQRIGADITKVAVMPRSRSDVLRLLEVSVQMREQTADRPFITMSMGRLGSISRMAGAFDGSAVTFATAGHASAPGQLPARALAGVLPALC